MPELSNLLKIVDALISECICMFIREYLHNIHQLMAGNIKANWALFFIFAWSMA